MTDTTAGDVASTEAGVAKRASAAGASAAVPRSERTYRQVYLWHWPIRAMHWIAALSVVVLVATGFYIGKPYFMTGGGGPGGSPYVMGTMRFIHFVAAGALVATGIVRLYWLFAGNKYERWRALFPLNSRSLRNLFRQMKAYFFFRPEAAPHYVGHNPLQQWSYTGIYVVTIAMVVTGFSLYGLHNPGGFFYQTFAWVGTLLGGAQAVRFWHHVLSWVFIIFFPVHVYFAIRADVTEREGALSSMVSGGKFVRDDLDYVDE